MTYKIRESFLPYALPDIDNEESKALIDVLLSKWISKGPKTLEFENKFAEFIGVKYAVAMNSCTAALHTSLISLGIKEGDEVITTPMTFASSVNTIIHSGATPIFVDIDPKTKCLDPSKIEEKITKKTKAIVPVHYMGHSCDMDPILDLANKYNLYVSEDAAHALCTKYNDKNIGTISDTTSFSFYATKNLCTCEGGMLTTNDYEIYKKAKTLSCHGMSLNAWNRYSKEGSYRYDIEFPGYKYNMFDIQAAMGLVQLKKLNNMQSRREYIAKKYNDAFNNIDCVKTPYVAPYTKHAWHLYILELNLDKLKISRDEFLKELNKRNIGTSVHFIPVHLMSYYQEKFNYKLGDFKVAEDYFNKIISIPLYPSMTDKDIDDVICAVYDVVSKFKLIF